MEQVLLVFDKYPRGLEDQCKSKQASCLQKTCARILTVQDGKVSVHLTKAQQLARSLTNH